VEAAGFGVVTGDVAWGGNWFFLVKDCAIALRLENRDALTALTVAIRRGLDAQGVRGADGHAVDHVELFAAAAEAGNDSRNFVLCPGGAYDRSPCGTGTSAKLACLAADGKLAPGETWRQEGILGTVFEGRYRMQDGVVIPSITGRAFITAASKLVVEGDDPFRMGIQPPQVL
jgi:proline racemase